MQDLLQWYITALQAGRVAEWMAAREAINALLLDRHYQ